MAYYIIEENYVGPEDQNRARTARDVIEIRSEPALTNMSHEPCERGWCGTTNDWAVYAHGKFTTLEAAEREVYRLFPAASPIDPDTYVASGSAVRAFRPWTRKPLSQVQTCDWIAEAAERDVRASTTDDELDSLFDEYELDAKSDGLELHYYSVATYLRELRDDKKGEMK